MFRPIHGIRFAAFLAGATLLTACGERGDTAGLAADDPSFAANATLLECPTDEEIAVSGVVSTLGGSIQVRNHRMGVPFRALNGKVEFEVAAPASRYMEIAIRPKGGRHYQFERPVSITIDYSRCPRTLTDQGPLTAWHIDEDTGALIEHMGGVDDKVSRTVTFESDHLSHFSIAQ